MPPDSSPDIYGNGVRLNMGSWRITLQRRMPEMGRLARMYNAAARFWHPVVGLLGYQRSYELLFRQLADDGWLVGVGEKPAILDVGIGTGALCCGLAEVVSPRARFHGVDIAPNMLAKADATLTRIDIEAQLQSADAGHLPYPDASFDLVMSAHLLEHCLDPHGALMEMLRVLKPGGLLLIVTTRVNRVSDWHALRWRYRSIDATTLCDWMEQTGTGRVRHYPLGGQNTLAERLSMACIGRLEPHP